MASSPDQPGATVSAASAIGPRSSTDARWICQVVSPSSEKQSFYKHCCAGTLCQSQRSNTKKGKQLRLDDGVRCPSCQKLACNDICFVLHKAKKHPQVHQPRHHQQLQQIACNHSEPPHNVPGLNLHQGAASGVIHVPVVGTAGQSLLAALAPVQPAPRATAAAAAAATQPPTPAAAVPPALLSLLAPPAAAMPAGSLDTSTAGAAYYHVVASSTLKFAEELSAGMRLFLGQGPVAGQAPQTSNHQTASAAARDKAGPRQDPPGPAAQQPSTPAPEVQRVQTNTQARRRITPVRVESVLVPQEVGVAHGVIDRLSSDPSIYRVDLAALEGEAQALVEHNQLRPEVKKAWIEHCMELLTAQEDKWRGKLVEQHRQRGREWLDKWEQEAPKRTRTSKQ